MNTYVLNHDKVKSDMVQCKKKNVDSNRTPFAKKNQMQDGYEYHNFLGDRKSTESGLIQQQNHAAPSKHWRFQVSQKSQSVQVRSVPTYNMSKKACLILYISYFMRWVKVSWT